VPIDSEHCALHQALRAGRPEEVERLILTASGGPFLDRDPASFGAIRKDEALRHPTWSMGEKITIDSATLVNKGLELIEAHGCSGPAERIDVVVHPQSIVHSLVAWCDGSLVAQLAPNDMVFPIQYALAYPERWPNRFPRLVVEELGTLEFRPLDQSKFPAVALARRALAMGDSATAVLNANEIAVRLPRQRIRFPAIIGRQACSIAAGRPVATVEEALEWDRWGRLEAERAISTLAAPR
jgi:1-deoxy-D-xylulose-5-phosphate reductoisomerase